MTSSSASRPALARLQDRRSLLPRDDGAARLPALHVRLGGNATPVWISIAHFLFSAFHANTTAFLLTRVARSAAVPGHLFRHRLVLWLSDHVRGDGGVRRQRFTDHVRRSNWGGAPCAHDWLMYIGLGRVRAQAAAPGARRLFLASVQPDPRLSSHHRSSTACCRRCGGSGTWRAQRRPNAARDLAGAATLCCALLGAALATALVLVGLTTLRVVGGRPGAIGSGRSPSSPRSAR